MKNIIVWLTLLMFSSISSFSQDVISGLADKPIFILKLHDGTQRTTRDPILLGKQVKSFTNVQKDLFLKQYPNIEFNNAFEFALESSVKKLWSLDEMFVQFNIAYEYRSLPVIIYGKVPAIDRNSILAAENSVESVTIDEKKRFIIIKTYFDNDKLK